MALVAVLWIVSVLTLLVSGLMSSVKNDIRAAGLHQQALIQSGHALAAMTLVLQHIVAKPPAPSRQTRFDVSYHDRRFQVVLTPLNGYIDINRASSPLLTALFRIGATQSAAAAEAMSTAILAERSVAQASGQGVAFEAVEDLMRIPGITFDVYRAIRALVTTDAQSSGSVNPYSSPLSVLVVLADGNLAAASAFDAARVAGRPDSELDATRFNPAYVDRSSSLRFMLEVFDPATVSGALLSRSVDLRGDRRMGQIWRYLN